MQEQLFNPVVRLCCELSLLWLLWQHLSVWERLVAHRSSQREDQPSRPVRQRHPQSPRDCPLCRAAHGTCEMHKMRSVVAWSSLKSKRGRPKSVESEGHCCQNEACAYYGVRDSQLHALVSHGAHRGADRIQYFKCQACGHKVSARFNTPMYRLKTCAARVQEVTTALGEGVDVAASSRIFGHDERTIRRWLARVAQHSQRLHQHYFRELVCQHLQLDELVTKIRGATERVFVWVALDAQTKIIPVIHLGGRKREDSMAFVHEVWQRLAPGCVPVFTTDGLWLYYYALTAHFGQWVPQAGRRWPVWQGFIGIFCGKAIYGGIKPSLDSPLNPTTGAEIDV